MVTTAELQGLVQSAKNIQELEYITVFAEEVIASLLMLLTFNEVSTTTI